MFLSPNDKDLKSNTDVKTIRIYQSLHVKNNKNFKNITEKYITSLKVDQSKLKKLNFW